MHCQLGEVDAQLKGLAGLERRCQDLMQEVKLLSERQEVLVGMVVNKRDMQKEAPTKYQEKMFEEFKELRGAKGKRSLELVRKKHVLTKWEAERERARMLQRLGGSRAIKHWNDAQGNEEYAGQGGDRCRRLCGRQ